MGYLPMYLIREDIDSLNQLLNQEPQLMFLTTIGKNKWKAVKKRDFTQELQRWESTGGSLWHIPASLAYLLQPPQDLLSINEPFPGIFLTHRQQDGTELLIEANENASLSAINLSTGVMRLSVQISQGEMIAKSDFQWTGNHYREIGYPAHSDTVVFWRRLKRLIRKVTVPFSMDFGGGKQLVYTFPHAYKAIQNGRPYSQI